MILQGEVTAVVAQPQGAVVLSWVDTVMTVVNAADFPRVGGSFTPDDGVTVFTFGQVTEGAGETDPDVVFTDQPAPANWPADETWVAVWPAAEDVIAEVVTDEDDTIPATVPHALRPLLAPGVRDKADREWVSLEQRGTEWVVSDVIGRAAQVQAQSVEGLPEVIEGQSVLDGRLVELDQQLGELDAAQAAAAEQMSAAELSIADAMKKAGDAWDAAAAATSKASEASIKAGDSWNAAVTAMDKAIASAESGGSLILNGGFEQLDANGKPVEWTATTTTTIVRTGARAGYLLANAPTSIALVSNWWPASTGRSYYVEAWVRRDGAATVDASKYIDFSMQVKTSTGTTATFYGLGRLASAATSDSTWTKISGTFSVTTADAVAVRARVWGASGVPHGWVVDDVLAVDVTEAVAAQKAAEAAQAAASTAQTTAAQAVTKTVTEYALSDSASTAPTSGWSTSAPARTPGRYVWMRQVVTYGNGTTNASSAAMITGNDGASGSGTTMYTWLKYADSATGAGMSDSPTGKKYMGIATNQASLSESSNPAAYSWSLITGEGVPGKDGTSLYTWVRYADTITGSGMSNDPTGKTYVGLAYNKTTATESSNTADYKWSLFQGPPGEGIPGEAGVSLASITPYWARQATKPAQPSGASAAAPWQATEPAWLLGTKLWRAERIALSNGTFQWTTVQEVSSDQAATQAINSANGKNTRYRGTGAPPANDPARPFVTGDTYWKIDSKNASNAIGQWGWDGTAWKPEFIASEVIANLDVHKLTVLGSAGFNLAVVQQLVADFATFKVLTADKVIVGSTSNLVPNGDMVSIYDGAAVTFAKASWVLDQTDKPAECFAAITMAPTAALTGGRPLQSPYQPFDAVPGGEYVFEFWAKASAPTRIVLECRNQSGAHAGVTTALGVTPGTQPSAAAPGNAWIVDKLDLTASWTKYSCVYKMGATTTRAYLANFYPNHTGGASADALVSLAGVRVRARNGGELIVDGSVTAKSINSDRSFAELVQGTVGRFTDVWANTVTADMINLNTLRGKVLEGVDWYSPNQTSYPRVHVGGGAVEVYRTAESADPDISMGGGTPDAFTVRNTSGEVLGALGRNGNVTAANLLVNGSSQLGVANADVVRVGGINIMSLITALPKGIIARQNLGATASTNSFEFGSTELGTVELQCTLDAQRAYRVVFDGLVHITQGAAMLGLRREVANGNVTPPAPKITSTQVGGTRLQNYQASQTSIQAHLETILVGPATAGAQTSYRILLTGRHETAGGHGKINSTDGIPAAFYVEDLGSYIEGADGGINLGGGTVYSGPAPVVVTPKPQAKEYTSVWTAAWLRDWFGSTIATDRMQQGVWGGVQRWSMAGFTAANSTGDETGKTMPQALTGSKISSVELLVPITAWFWGSGGRLWINTHGYATAPASRPTGTGVATGNLAVGTQWVTLWTASGGGVLTSTQVAGMATGATDGITFGEGAGASDYCTMTYSPGAFKLRATYTK